MSFVCVVAGQPSAAFKLIDTERSPKRTFQIEYYENTNKSTAQIWIAKVGKSTKKLLLFGYGKPEAVSTLISEDDKWLVLNHREGCDSTRPILFKKVSGIHFEELKGIDLDSVVWGAAATNQGFSVNTTFDHSYSQAICWLGDSHSLVLRAWGYYSGEYYLNDWFCIYNVETRKVSFDLTALNNRAFHSVKHGASD